MQKLNIQWTWENAFLQTLKNIKWTEEEHFTSTAMRIIMCVSLELESCDREMIVLVLDAFIPMDRKIKANNSSMSIEKS